MADTDLSYEEVGEILRLIEQLDYDEVIVEFGDVKIRVARGGSSSTAAAPAPPPTDAASRGADRLAEQAGEARDAPAPRAEPAVARPPDDEVIEGAVAVKAPMVGTFYRAPSPDEPTFVEVGSKVAAGDQVAIIEVMKLMNAIVAEVDGVVKRIDVDNAVLVEYGQTLMWIEPLR